MVGTDNKVLVIDKAFLPYDSFDDFLFSLLETVQIGCPDGSFFHKMRIRGEFGQVG